MGRIIYPGLSRKQFRKRYGSISTHRFMPMIFFAALFAAVIIVWLVLSSLEWHYAPRWWESARLTKAESAVRMKVHDAFPGVEVSVRLRAAYNAYIVIPHADSEAMKHQQRLDQFVRSVGQAWCNAVEDTLLPSVRVLDAGDTEQQIGSFSCTLGTLSSRTREKCGLVEQSFQ